MRSAQATVYREKAVLVAVVDPRHAKENQHPPGDPRRKRARSRLEFDPLNELASLADTAGAVVVERIVQHRERPDPRTYVGAGKVEEIAAQVKEVGANVVIFDHDLSPAQVRSLERAIEAKVIDRAELILDIFATHARTNEAKLQVELAQLEYNLPRLKRMWTHLGQQVSGGGGMGGGIGTRGPGEKQIEVDRRIARKRITELKGEIRQIEKRKQREVSTRTTENFGVSLVGYTNAGKSTLMNRLTGAGVLVEDRLFSTLDTRTRIWSLRTGIRAFLSDTVGFIRDLPHDLVASFHATLEEVTQADLLLHVVDATHPEMESQIASVRSVLSELHVPEKETLLVFNKIDGFRDAVEREVVRGRHPDGILVSAHTGEGIAELVQRVERVVYGRLEELEVQVPLREGKLLSELSTTCVVLEQEYGEEHVRMRLRVPPRQVWKLQAYRTDVPSAP